MRPEWKLVGGIAKSLLVVVLTALSLVMLYDVAGSYKAGQEFGLKLTVLTIAPATYLWWLVERVLKLLGVRRSAGFSLLVSLALTIWIMVAALRFRIEDEAFSLSEKIWNVLESAVLYVMRLFA